LWPFVPAQLGRAHGVDDANSALLGRHDQRSVRQEGHRRRDGLHHGSSWLRKTGHHVHEPTIRDRADLDVVRAGAAAEREQAAVGAERDRTGGDGGDHVGELALAGPEVPDDEDVPAGRLFRARSGGADHGEQAPVG
jgi:hypothetical protein